MVRPDALHSESTDNTNRLWLHCHSIASKKESSLSCIMHKRTYSSDKIYILSEAFLIFIYIPPLLKNTLQHFYLRFHLLFTQPPGTPASRRFAFRRLFLLFPFCQRQWFFLRVFLGSSCNHIQTINGQACSSAGLRPRKNESLKKAPVKLKGVLGKTAEFSSRSLKFSSIHQRTRQCPHIQIIQITTSGDPSGQSGDFPIKNSFQSVHNI
jgi:hypothetical protein